MHIPFIVSPFIQALHSLKPHDDNEAVAPLHSTNKVITIHVVERRMVVLQKRPGFSIEPRIL